jgi:hypothetical protein
MALRVRCFNVDRGCEWKGTVSTLEEHLTTCEFTLVPCPKKCRDISGNIQCFVSKNLDEHLEKNCPNRDYQCKQCGENGTYISFMQVHNKICKKKLTVCPNLGCIETMQRQGIKRHLETCVHTEVLCKYRKLGCDVSLSRQSILEHESDDKLHLHLALDKVVAMEEKIESLREEVRDGGGVSLRSGESMTFKVTEFQSRVECGDIFESPKFYTPEGYRMEVKIYTNGFGHAEGTNVSVFVRVVEGKYDSSLKWPYVGNITCSLMNQLKDRSHHEITIPFEVEDNHLVGSTMTGVLQFIPHLVLEYDAVDKTQYLMDDTLYFRISAEVDIPSQRTWLQCTPAVSPNVT